MGDPQIDITTTPGKIQMAQKLKEEGNEFFKKQEYKQAIKKYRVVFAYVNGLLEPDSQYAQYDSSHLLSEADSSTVKKLKVAVYSNLAAAYLKTDKPEKSYDCCNKGLVIDNDHAKLRYRMAQSLIRLNDFDRAKGYVTEAVKADPKSRIYRDLLEEWKQGYEEWKKEQAIKEKEMFGGTL